MQAKKAVAGAIAKGKARHVHAEPNIIGIQRSTRARPARKKGITRLERRQLSPEEREAQRTRLQELITLGSERSYLTYAEINDHLPGDMLDAEQIEGIVSMINGMGIQVYDEPPDAENLLMAEVRDVISEEEAKAALSVVDCDFGSTSDPVRMYLREMASADLLTRAEETEIAKRIEGGLRDMVHALFACPSFVAEILALGERIEKGELPVDEVIDGLGDSKAAGPVVELAERGDLAIRAEAAGVVEPILVVEVKSKASGEVLQLFVETGDEVLDYREAVEYYAGALQEVVRGGDHSMVSFPEHIPEIVEWAKS